MNGGQIRNFMDSPGGQAANGVTLGGIALSVMQMLPTFLSVLASIAGLIWCGIMIYESDTFRSLCHMAPKVRHGPAPKVSVFVVKDDQDV
jgi:hypothetical protein